MTQATPSQDLVAKDLHGYEWRFKHIFRGKISEFLIEYRLQFLFHFAFGCCIIGWKLKKSKFIDGMLSTKERNLLHVLLDDQANLEDTCLQLGGAHLWIPRD